MSRYFFHLHDGSICADEEGFELPDLQSVRDHAIRGARDIIAEDAKMGEIWLSHWIEVENSAGALVLTIQFEDAVLLAGRGSRVPAR